MQGQHTECDTKQHVHAAHTTHRAEHRSSQDACRARSLGQAQVCLRNEAPTACQAWHSIYCWRHPHRPNSQPCCPMQHTMTSGQATETTAQQQLSAAHSKGKARQHPGCQTATKGQLSTTTPKPCVGSTQQPCLEKNTGIACPTHIRTHPTPTPQLHTPALKRPQSLEQAHRTTPACPSVKIQHSQSHTADRKGSVLSPPLITRTPQGWHMLTRAMQTTQVQACTLQPGASSSLAQGTRVGD